MQVHDPIIVRGDILRVTEYDNGKITKKRFKNTVLNNGRRALTASLANQFGDMYSFFIHKMVFGDGGCEGEAERFIGAERTGLFGITRAAKPVITRIDNTTPSQLILTSILTFDDANDYVLNEMGLQMANGQLYSMVTMPNFTKRSNMQLTWSWRLSFL